MLDARPAPPPPFAARPSLRKSLLFLLILAALVAGMAYIIWFAFTDPQGYAVWQAQECCEGGRGEGAPFMLLAFSLILILPCYYFWASYLQRIVGNEPFILIDYRGLYHQDWNVGSIPWWDISDTEIICVEDEARRIFWHVPRHWYVAVYLKDPVKYLEKKYGGGRFDGTDPNLEWRIHVNMLNTTPEELQAHIQAALVYWQQADVLRFK